jgi:thiosulfate dehydrogenase [quinone] large subunit
VTGRRSPQSSEQLAREEKEKIMATPDTAPATQSVMSGSKLGWVSLSLARIGIGFVFLWAFLDKLIGLGFATCRNAETGVVEIMCDSAWLQGGHITEGYLKSAAGEFGGEPMGVYGELFKGWGDFAIGSFRPLDWVFMLGLAGVGLALMLGIGTKIGAWSAVGLLMMMYIAHFDNTNNPVIDDHIVYSLAAVGIVYVELQRQAVGIGKWWRELPLVKKNDWLV